MEVLSYIRTSFWILLFLFSSEVIAQITDTESAYRSLDSFLEAPSLEGAAAFKNDLKQWNATAEDEQLAKVVSYCNLGYYEQQFLRFQEAILSYETAKQLYRKHALSGYDMINSCYIPLGNLYTKTNALSEAENQIKEYVLLAQRTNKQAETVAGLLNLSVVFQSQGAHLQAVAVLEEGLKMAPNDDRLRLNLASNHLRTGEIDISEKIINQLLKRDPTNVKAYQLLAEIQLKKEKPAAALHALKLATANLGTNKKRSVREIAKLGLSMAATAIQLGNDNDALFELRKIYSLFIPDFEPKNKLPTEEQLIAENTLIDALDLQALIYTKQGNSKMAYQAYKLAFKVSNKLDAATLVQDSKIVQSGVHKIRSEKSLNLLYALYEIEKDTIWLHEAVQIDQRSKSPVLRKARRLQEQLSTSKDTGLVCRIQKAQLNSSFLLNQLEAVKNAPAMDVKRLELVQQKYNAVTVSLRDLYSQFGTPFLADEAAISLDNLKAASIAKGETGVSYFFGKESIFQFVVSEGALYFNKLADSKETCSLFLERCSRVNAFYESPSAILNAPDVYTRHANELYELLAIPKAKKLVIIPDGVLSFLPMSALLTESTPAITFADMPFLIRSSEISYALSLQDFLIITEPKKFKGSVLGVFPVFEDTNRELTYSIQEAEALKRAMDAQVLTRNEATVTAFLDKAPSFDVIHISSHALGGTFTSAAGIEFVDRTLFIDELYGLQFNKDLVVLSACETGVGKIIRGEGVQSMARAFQYTGAQNTLFSLWKVNDFTTARLMESFYRNLNEKGSFNHALYQSKIDFLADPDVDNSKKSPYNWAAFVYYGNTQIPEENMNLSWWIFLGIIPILALIFLRKRKSRN